jgi:hypothetical protein
VVHKADTLLSRQVILNQTISFHQTEVITAGRRKICLYKLIGGSPFEAYTTTGNHSGLIVINNGRVDILDN